jgi:hypothetical protein
MLYELMSVVSLALLLWILLFPYNNYRVDWIRQSMFALRDELFDEARAGTISFDSQAYRATRATMNGAIRFAHRLSVSRMIAFRLLARARSGRDGLTRAMDASPEADRQLCATYLVRADRIVMRYIFSSPLVLALVVPPTLMFLLGRAGIDVTAWAVGVCRKQFADFNRIAFQEGTV